MRTCQGCGGVLGRDCFNETDCVNITHRMEQHQRQQSDQLPEWMRELEERIDAIEKHLLIGRYAL